MTPAWLLLVLALGVRVAQILATGGWDPVADPADYVRHAISIAAGHGMPESLVPGGGPTALRPPAYPWFLGGVFAVTGDSETAGRLASALLGAVTVGLTGLIACQLWGRRAAVAALAIAAVYPPLVLVSGTLLSEALALPLMLALLALLLHDRGRPRGRQVAPIAGLLFGLALLDRPALAVLALALVAALWDPRASGLRRLREPLAALAVAALVVLPWTVRNAIEFDAFVPISTQSGFLVAGTYNEASDADPKLPGANRPPGFAPSLRPIVTDASLDEREMSSRLSAAARDYARAHPGYVPRAIWWNGLRLLGLSRGVSGTETGYAFQGIRPGWADAAVIAWYVLAACALGGVALGALRGGPWWLWSLAPLLVASVVWISGDVRYRLPLEPFVVLAAAYALARLTDRRPAPPPRPTPPPP